MLNLVVNKNMQSIEHLYTILFDKIGGKISFLEKKKCEKSKKNWYIRNVFFMLYSNYEIHI